MNSKIDREQLVRVARIYKSNQDASQVLGIAIRSFARLCRRYGKEEYMTMRTRRSKAVGSGGMSFALMLILLVLSQNSTDARITTFEIASRESFGSFEPGEYLRITGEATGELMVTEPITDLTQADPEGTGVVQYSTDFILIVPEDLSKSNGTLLFDVENRGNPIAHTLYNRPRDSPEVWVEIGNGFVEEQGFMLAIASWELGQGITWPTFSVQNYTILVGTRMRIFMVRRKFFGLEGISSTRGDHGFE